MRRWRSKRLLYRLTVEIKGEDSMMSKKKLLHIITAVSFVGFIMLESACVTPQWKDVIYNGEDSKLLEGNAYVITIINTNELGFIDFLSDGKLNGIGRTWERVETNVKIKLARGYEHFEGIYNHEDKTIIGTQSFSGSSYKQEVRLDYIGEAGRRFDSNVGNFTFTQIVNGFDHSKLMRMTSGGFYKYGFITDYTGTGTRIWIPSIIDNKNVSGILKRAFYDKKLTFVYFNNGGLLSDIGNQAFANNQLTYLKLPENITGIDDQAFANNPLITINIGANVRFNGLPFGNNFENVYTEGGRQAGIYTRPNTNSTTWTKQ
jgi:hypothetical protein